MNGKKVSVFIAFTVIGALALAGCGAGGGGEADSKDATIGLAMPVTGPDAALAAPMIAAIELAFDEANKSGDLPGVLTLDVQDDTSAPAVAASLARRFCGDSATVAAIANYASSLTLNSQPVYNDCGMTQIVPTASNNTLTTKGYENFFRVTAKNSDAVVGSVDWIVANTDAKSVATIDTNDASTTDAATQFADAAKDAGLEVTDSIHVTANQGDFRGAITGLIADKPDLIYLATFYNDGGLIVKQARELGYTGEFFGLDSNDSPDFIEIAGAEAAEGFRIASLGLDPTQNPEASDFVKAFTDSYGSAPNSAASQSYDTANVLIEAWKSIGGGTDREALMKAVAETSLEGVGGPISFDENGDMKEPQVGINLVSGGEWQFVGAVE